MDPLALALRALVVPAATAAAVGLAVGGLPRGETSLRQQLAGALAVAAAWVAGGVAVAGLPAWPPVEATQWLLVLGLPLGLAGALRALGDPPLHLGVVVRGLAVLGATWVLLAPLRAHSWSTLESAVWTAGVATLAAGVWTAVEEAAERVPARGVLAALTLWAGLVAVTVAGTGSLVMGQLAFTLAAGLGALAALAHAGPRGHLATPAAATATPLVLGMLLLGTVFSELHPGAAALLALAPVGLFAGRKPWRAVVLTGLLAATGAGLGLGLDAARTAQDAASDPYQGYYDD